MRSASRLFYLSVFALWTPSGSCASNQNECAISPRTIVDDACVSFATLDKLNAKVKPAVDDLTQTTDFFSHYRLNLFNKECPFWNDSNGVCGNIACAVDTIDNEEDIPLVWRASELGKLEGPLAKHPPGGRSKQPAGGSLLGDSNDGCVMDVDEQDERDYCVPDDESAASKGDYVSLLSNPERFTGYGGESAKQVWDAIYRENCFQRSSFPHAANLGRLKKSPGAAAQDFKSVLDTAGRQRELERQRLNHPNMAFVANTGYEHEDECLEKRVFYRVMSGMHASISAHLCWDFLNQSTGEWTPNVQCYANRLHGHPDRISNLYFNFALITRAVAKLGPYLRDRYTFCSGDASEDAATRAKVLEVTEKAASVPQIFDESLMFVNGEGPSLKEDFRNRFRNVSRLMDCVGCDKCRLWGKLQTNGYGTALKVLFESDNNSGHIPSLKRTEVVALFNTYARLGESLRAVGKFRAMVEPEEGDEWAIPAPESEPEPEPEPEPELEEPRPMWRVEPEEDDPILIEFIIMRNRGPDGDTLSDVFKFQFKLLAMAVRVVLMQWMRVPGTIWHVITSELTRLFHLWLGLPVMPRKWGISLPNLNRDDL